MKEHLFRGKIKNSNAWVNGYYVRYLGIDYILVQNIITGKDIFDAYCLKEMLSYDLIKPKMQWVEVIPETVGRYSNLKDKHKKETFENDIIQCRFYNEDMDTQNVENLIIIFSRENNQWIVENMDGDHVGDFDKEFEENIEFYLIGNKFDNPELLKE